MKSFILSLFLYCAASAAHAQGIPNAQGCTARHALSGQPVPVRQSVGPSQFWAQSRWDPDGWPSITYNAPYFNLPPLMQTFTSAHECGHLVLQTDNELLANCFALRNLPLSGSDKQFIAQYHIGIGSIGPQYGGSGAAFWAGTVRTCPNDAS